MTAAEENDGSVGSLDRRTSAPVSDQAIKQQKFLFVANIRGNAAGEITNAV